MGFGGSKRTPTEKTSFVCYSLRRPFVFWTTFANCWAPWPVVLYISFFCMFHIADVVIWQNHCKGSLPKVYVLNKIIELWEQIPFFKFVCIPFQKPKANFVDVFFLHRTLLFWWCPVIISMSPTARAALQAREAFEFGLNSWGGWWYESSWRIIWFGVEPKIGGKNP